MAIKFLYCGMRNHGGPGKIGFMLKSLCDSVEWQFYWFHSSPYIPSTYSTPYDVSLDQILEGNWEFIFYNQWRNRSIFDQFNYRSAQILFLMLEDIPEYINDFLSPYNYLLAASRRIHEVIDQQVKVIQWRIQPPAEMVNHNAGARFFFPARDGGENDRKSILVVEKAIPHIRGDFELNLTLTSQSLVSYEPHIPNILSHPNINILNELTNTEYQNQLIHNNVLLCPSKTSGVEFSIFDAIQHNMQIITTDTAPMNEYFSNNEAWLVKSVPDKTYILESISRKIQIYQPDYYDLAQIMNLIIQGKRKKCISLKKQSILWEQFLNSFKGFLCDILNTVKMLQNKSTDRWT